MERKRDAKLFLFYVNINYRIFHVYNNLLLATSGVVVVDVDKMPVPFPISLAGNDVVVVVAVIAAVSFALAADTFVVAPTFSSPTPFVKLAEESVAKAIAVDSDAFAEFAVVAAAAAAAAAAFFSSAAKRSFFFV